MRYRIGEVADFFSLTKEGVRYLERQGIIRSVRNENNGYRYYPREEITRLKLIRSYQAIGFTLEEVERMLRETMRTEMLIKLDEKVCELQARETQLKRMKQMLLSQRRAARYILTNEKHFDFKMRPAYFLFPRVRDEASGKTEQERTLITWERRIEKMWIQAMPPVKLAALHYNSKGAPLENLYGCAAPKIVAEKQRLPIPPSAILLPACLCAHGVAEGAVGAHPAIEEIMAWIGAQGLRATGDVFALMQLTYRNETGKLLRLHELFIPVGHQ